ncbi:hypothetical protein LOTGIDRAFT_167223 [Lottia gigantea]|uniref:Ribosomal protein L7Ae/L30e/S12e/Gadd45 domain-containing protein n=1 Tax=Lottia gigantea TaxID=225164 RepID=V4BDC3_LOTGI|nr:hypothetical protein LOTGIDRAFT_167223 [Lottia gigantea]ESO86409.1 hypothetical protein LOTGIDRAFT_167223 [Lottia gigantea]
MLKESFPLRLVQKFCSNKERKMFTKQQKENKLSDEQNEELKTRKQIRSELALGINCVTKALEKDELRLVIITRESKVCVLVNHILPLVTVRQCPAIRLPNLSENMYNILGLQSLAALGFKKTKEKSMFEDFVHMVIETAPSIKSSWLQEPEIKSEISTKDMEIETTPEEVNLSATIKSVIPEKSLNPETSHKAAPVFKKDYSYLYVYKKDQKLGDDFISLSSNTKTDEDYFPTEPKKSKSEQTGLVSMKYKGVNVQAMKKNEKRKKKKKCAV